MPITDEWIKKMYHIYAMEYYSAIKKKYCLCHNMDGPRGYYAKWKKSDGERQTLYIFTYMWNLEKQTNITKQKQTHRYREQTGGCQRRGESKDGQSMWRRIRGTNYRLSIFSQENKILGKSFKWHL